MNTLSYNELIIQKQKLQNDIKLGIDTEDTWIDLDNIKFALKFRKFEFRRFDKNENH